MLSECKHYLSEYALENIEKIHEKYKTSGKDNLEELKAELLSVMQNERDINWFFWRKSPKGIAYLCYCYDQILLITLDDCYMLMRDGRLCEGELDIEIKKWIEEDHVLFFNTYYIVRNQTDCFFCYYGNEENFFVGKIEEEPTDPFSGTDKKWLTEDWW